MKLHLLLTAVALGMAAQVQAQENPVPPRLDPGSGAGFAERPKARPENERGTTAFPGADLEPQPPATKPSSIFNLNLDASKLGDAIGQIEDGIGDALSNKGEQRLMPNIIFSADSRDAVMPGNMRLTGVSPVQAVALVCAAAGCSMEPIYAPAEETVLPGSKIIGYRIVRESAQKSDSRLASKPSTFTGLAGSEKIKADIAAATAKLRSLQERYSAHHPSVSTAEKDLLQLQRSLEQNTVESTPSVGGIGITLAKKDDGVVVGEILPGSPASAHPEIKSGQRILGVAEAGKPPVETSSATIDDLVKLLRGEPGTSVEVTFGINSDKGTKEHTVKLVRTGLPIPDPNVSSGVPIVKAVDNTFYLASLLTDKEKAIVRVYALRGILDGDTKGENERALEDLVTEALDKAGVRGGKEKPELSFHKRSGVLLVKATASQQEIISQIIEAMKENGTQPMPPDDQFKLTAPIPAPNILKPEPVDPLGGK